MEVERVQAIASLLKHADSIPSEFIRSENEQPAASTVHGVVLEVPVIDIGGDSDDEKMARLMSEASREWGIFQVVNHGIPHQLIAKLQLIGKEFFELPKEEKELIAKTPDSGIQGYGTTFQKDIDESKKGWGDHLFHKIWPPSAINYNFWPKNPTSYREVNEEYTKRLREVSNKLMKWLSLGLGLEEQELKEAMGGEETIYLMRINYYPPCPRPDLALGLGAHNDISGLTILVPNEVEGLQVYRDGHWYDVKHIPNALIIHIGDQIEIISNGKYKAVFHRATVNKESTRMSWPVFVEPPAEFEVGPIPKLVTEHSPPKYKSQKYKDYVDCKLNELRQ